MREAHRTEGFANQRGDLGRWGGGGKTVNSNFEERIERKSDEGVWQAGGVKWR